MYVDFGKIAFSLHLDTQVQKKSNRIIFLTTVQYV